MRTSDFDFALPADLIAQSPAAQRDGSRLLVLHRHSSLIEHERFAEVFRYFQAGDVLVLNDSRVIPARLHGSNAKTGGQFELLLLEEVGVNDWWVMLRPGKRAREGTRIMLRDTNGALTDIQATVLEKNSEGHGRVNFSATANILEELNRLGEVPLPPYIERNDTTKQAEDRERYQTIFARESGSVAAPTAGLHFTERLLEEIRHMGVQVCFVTLHVGLGTFAPVKSENLAEHPMHEERYQLSAATAELINSAKAAGRRIVAVGTTTVRVLEGVARQTGGLLNAGGGRTRIFIYPPFDFKIVDVMLTNFHLPQSTLLMLVSAFAAPGKTEGRQLILSAYNDAISKRYRFYSYGDAMMIV